MRAAFGWTGILVAVCGWAPACGGSSKSKHAPVGQGPVGHGGSSGDASGATGAGTGSSLGGQASGGSAFGGSHSGNGGAAAGTSGSPPGIGGAAGGSGGVAAGGVGAGGVVVTPGGSAGTAALEAGQGGSDQGGAAGCIDLCTTDAPECCMDALRCLGSAPPSCRIDVLDGFVSKFSDYAAFQAEVAGLSGIPLITITDAAVVRAAIESPMASRLELHLSAEASHAYGALLAKAMGSAFRVTCGDEELFVGVLYQIYGAAVFGTPVLLLPDAPEDAVVIELGAFQGAQYGATATGDFDLERERFDRSELRAAFCARRLLDHLDPL